MLNGRYGPYITDKLKNARVPKDRDPKSLTLEECRALLEAAPLRPQRGRGRFGRAPGRRQAARRAQQLPHPRLPRRLAAKVAAKKAAKSAAKASPGEAACREDGARSASAREGGGQACAQASRRRRLTLPDDGSA